MAFRRRRKGGAWLPVNPTFLPNQDPATGFTWFEDRLAFSGPVEAGDGSFAAVPLTLDNTIDPGGATSIADQSLRDYVQGQDYTLNRVVGKVWAGAEQQPEALVERFIACIGLAVLPTDPGQNSPKGPPQGWDPLLSQNAQEPWIWRRTWILNNGSIIGNSPFFATSTAQYGSVLDGGHLDSKIKRRITREHRLYIIYGWEATSTQFGESPADSAVVFGYDLRINGAMRHSMNRSSF